MKYLVRPQRIEIRTVCFCYATLPPNCPDNCNANCRNFCGAQVCSPRMEPMSLN